MITSLLATNGIVFPHVDPVIFAIGPFAIRWYALAYVAGILLGWYYINYLRKRKPESIPDAAYENIILWAILGILLGGRLGYVLFYNFGYYLSHPGEIIAVWKGGMSFHGGLIGVIVSMWLMAKRYKIAYLPLMDMLACASPIGLFFGRIANFINGELYGRPTEEPWGVIFPYSDGLARHPSQLYEAGLEGLLLFFIMFILAKRRSFLDQPGRLCGVFLIGYSTARAFIEVFREPDVQIGYIFDYFTMGQMLCIPMLILGLVLAKKKRQPVPQTSVTRKRSNKPLASSSKD